MLINHLLINRFKFKFFFYLELNWFIAIVEIELTEEARVLAPKLPYIGYSIETHCKTFQANAKCPTNSIVDTCCLQYLLSHDSTAQQFQPLAIVKNFKLPRRMSEWKVFLVPFVLDVCKKKKYI